MIRRLDYIIIENVYPELDSGRYPVKREVGDVFEVRADIFKEGHDILSAVLKYRRKRDDDWHEVAMELVDNDRWCGSFALQENTTYIYIIEAFTDVFESWKSKLMIKSQAGEDIAAEILDGLNIIGRAAERASGSDSVALSEILKKLKESRSQKRMINIICGKRLAKLMARCPDKSDASLYDRELEVVVDRLKARFSTWYEMFHRSQGKVLGKSATFADCEQRLTEIKRMGFDVVYLPPIHPIGITNRKGRNNVLQAGANDPGSPWAIGNKLGGHKAVNPELGDLGDFEHFVQAAVAMEMEVALDFAIHCSADHPYLEEHPEWFYKRADGSMRYAENPPKKYQDIYPLNLLCEERDALWEELKSILIFWIEKGVKIFRVDNPHTKPFHFWKWLIEEVHKTYPDVIFLGEAFTRPKLMKFLAKVGFTQSYTYFTWRNFKGEFIDYLTELTQSGVKEYLRGNLFTNTPDILSPILQQGGRPAFKMRLILAATLSSIYGIYNGFELCEREAIPGTEDYLNSEKYEYKVWDWDRRDNIKEYIAKVNRIRRKNHALQLYKNLRFYPSDDENIIFYGKMTPNMDNIVLVAVNLDPYQPHESYIYVPIEKMGISPKEKYNVEELITGATYVWTGEKQKVLLDPQIEPAMIFKRSD